MLRELITWVLNTYLGKYLENFNSAQLTVALLSGEVELENVPFRRDALHSLGLPLIVSSGSVGKIKLHVPVRQFRTAPWCISLEKIHVVICPIDLKNWNDEKEELADLNYKLLQLNDLEAKWRAKNEANIESGYYASSYSGWLSYGTGLATHIIQNLQLKVNDVHIRYEDGITAPNMNFSVGLIIDSLSAQSCDSNWDPKSSNINSTASFKLVDLRSFAVYWDPKKHHDHDSDNSTEIITKTESFSKKEYRYIINPISAQARFRLDRSETPLRTRNRPRYFGEVKVDEINFSLSDLQYTQVIESVRGIKKLIEFRQYRLHRPKQSIHENPRSWWKYVAKCHGFTFPDVERKQYLIKDNMRYIKLCMKMVLNPEESITADDKKFKYEMEKKRDVEDLMNLRKISLHCLPAAEILNKTGKRRGNVLFQWFPQWWGWYGNSGPPSNIVDSYNVNNSTGDTQEENACEQSMIEDELLDALEGPIDDTSLFNRDAVFGKFEFLLRDGTFNICKEDASNKQCHVIMMQMYFNNLMLGIEARLRSASYLVTLSLGSLYVKDCITHNTQFPELIKPQNKETFLNRQKLKKDITKFVAEVDSLFYLQYEHKPLTHNTDYRLVIKTKPLEVVYNIGPLQWLVNFVSKPFHLSPEQKIAAMKNRTKMKLIKNCKDMLEGDLRQRKSWALTIDISAPQIILAEDLANKHTTVVLIDLGRIQLLKNYSQQNVRQQHKKESNLSKLASMESEEEDAFMTPCSTPPGSEVTLSDSPTLQSDGYNVEEPNIAAKSDLENALHDKIYDKYTIDLTDLQMLVFKGKDKLNLSHMKGTSSYHILDRFDITLEIERRIINTIDPQYPSLTLFGKLPILVVHVNEQKISALSNILDIVSENNSEGSHTSPTTTLFHVENEDEISQVISDQETNTIQKELSNLIVLQFMVDQMSLEIQSRGRSIVELQVTGVKAGLNKRLFETSVSLSVHGLLLVDAIQSFGQDFELLVASHRHVGIDTISGSLKQSEPSSPLSPASPDYTYDRRPTSPMSANRTIRSDRRDSGPTSNDINALIAVEILFVCSEDSSESLQIANIQFNNLDIIANQETILELMDFVKSVFPNKETSRNKRKLSRKRSEFSISEPDSKTLMRTEINFDFHRLNVLILRALMRDNCFVGRKVGTFTMSEATIHATFGKEDAVEGSLGGLQVLDLTPEGVNHQRILSVGKDPLTEVPTMKKDLLSSLTEEIYGLNQSQDEISQYQAFSFSIKKDTHAVVNVKIRMASVWYTHCARFLQELSWCATEFKENFKNFAKSIREKAADMALGLVQLRDGSQNKSAIESRRTKSLSIDSTILDESVDTEDKISLDVVLDTPVVVIPRSSSSTEVLVAHLGKIYISNTTNRLLEPYYKNSLDDNENFNIHTNFPYTQCELNKDENPPLTNCRETKTEETYLIDVRNMNLFSLDTAKRKEVQTSPLPRAEEFYSCRNDAVAILHDTAIQLYITKAVENINETSDISNETKDILQVKGSVMQPLQLSLSRQQYEQLLETTDNIFKVPHDLVQPPSTANISLRNTEIDDETLLPSFVHDEDQYEEKQCNINTNAASDNRTNLEPKIVFELPIFIVQLKDIHNTPIIEVSFRELIINYNKKNLYETSIKVSLQSILMEDLLCPDNSKYRQMVVSSSTDEQAPVVNSVLSSSCPNLNKIYRRSTDVLTGSLPGYLERDEASQINLLPNYTYSGNSNNTLYPETPPPSPQQKDNESNLVIYSSLLVDTECPDFSREYNSVQQASSIDFNSLDLIISVERWYLLLDFFGLMTDEETETSYTKEEIDTSVKESVKGNTNLEVKVRSLTLVLVHKDSEIAKTNISNALFIISKQQNSKTVTGRLGSVSVVDLTRHGEFYREKFLTIGTEALKFIYKRETEKSNQRTLNKDAKLKLQMSSVRYVHTKRFIMEIQAFVREFLQIQTSVMRKFKVSDSRYFLHQRPTQLGLEIKAGSPIVVLPSNFQSDEVIIADLGQFSLKNNFHLASEKGIISVKNDATLLDEILDVMLVDVYNTDFFTGYRLSKSKENNRKETPDLCLDMGSYWIIKQSESMLKDKCHLKLQIERNMDSWKSHNCPDFSIQGVLSRLEIVLNLDQYKLVRGFLSYNLGELTDDIYTNYLSLPESTLNLSGLDDEKNQQKATWINMSIDLALENVSMLLTWSPDELITCHDCESPMLACINFIKSRLKIDMFSDGSQDIDLISQEILVTDSRFQDQEEPKNVFQNILQPIDIKPWNNIVQAEVHSRKRNDHTKFTVLLNNMRLMAIIDWLENMQEYLSQNSEPPSSFYDTQLIADNTLSSGVKIPMELIFNITDSELVFVEKTNQFDTNAIILKSTTVFTFNTMETSKPISINLNNLELFSCILGFEEETALSIIDPITINADLRENILEIQLQKQLCIRLSYHDMIMFTRMMQCLPKQTKTAQKKGNQKSKIGNNSHKYFVKKLSALGFCEVDCIRALEESQYQLDEAALWLTQNSKPKKNISHPRDTNGPLKIHAVEIHANCISVCVIDDCKDADVPLLELSLSQLDFRQELSEHLLNSKLIPNYVFGMSGFYSGHLKAQLACDYYNRQLSGWEPVIEPWKCLVNWNYSMNYHANKQSRINLSIAGEDLLKLNITSAIIELWQLVRANWAQDFYEDNDSPIAATNRSPNAYRRRNPFVPFSLKNNTGVPLRFKIMVTTPGGITQTEFLRAQANGKWIMVEPGNTQQFSFGEQNKIRHINSHKLNLHQIIVHLEGWSEVGPLTVDKVGTYFRHAYRENFIEFPRLPKARVVFDVSLHGSAQKLITVRSALRLFNYIDHYILLKMEHPINYMGIPSWPVVKEAIVEPNANISIPLTYVHSSLYFRPILSKLYTESDDGSTSIANVSNVTETWKSYDRNRIDIDNYYQFSDKSIHWKNCVDGSEILQEIVTCKNNIRKTFNILATVRREVYPVKHVNTMPGHTIVLLPPLRINNLLCCDLIYKISSVVQGRVQPSATANIFEITFDEDLNLNIILDGYSIAGQICIQAGQTGYSESRIRLIDTQNRDLHLQASVQVVKGYGMEISVSAPFWLVNRTGLPLIFRQEGVTRDASGQFSEHEQARLLSPLMFSFSDSEASPNLIVRLGKRYGSDLTWCQPFSLREDIIHRQLKSQFSKEIFSVGIEVRRGRGRYSRTSVVTFSPRFQLYNGSSHKLEFAQKCYATAFADPEAKSTVIEAIPGCHLPFHWPRLDREPILCVRLADVEGCLWSGGISINEVHSLYINIRNSHGDMHFLRLEIILQGATYFLLFGDAQALPPPIRLDNYSEVSIKFNQPGCKYQWRTVVKPHSSISYALDEPMGSKSLQIEAPGGVVRTYSLKTLGMSHNLTYENFIYIAFKGTFQCSSTKEKHHEASEYDIESQNLVLGVKDNRVTLVYKRPGDRSQLWRMNQNKQLEHEGSSPPTEPGKVPTNIHSRLVLDLEKPPNPMQYTSLVVRSANIQRKSTQTWRFTEDGRLMCEHANMCVQSRDGVFGLRPGCEAVLGMISTEKHKYGNSDVPVEQLIERQKLRPGSGCLSVAVSMDGPIKTIQIRDINFINNIPLNPDPVWRHASHLYQNYSSANSSSKNVEEKFIDEYNVKVELTHGMGISIISKKPREELAYITLDNICLEGVVTPNVWSMEVNLGDIQIDNQLFETPCPVLLYTPPFSSADSKFELPVMQFTAKLLPSPNKNAIIFERVIFRLRPFVLYLEERLMLRLAIFFGFDKSQKDNTAVDESDYEAQQVATKILAANTKRYYFGDLQIDPSQIRLSVITASKLPSKLSDVKRKLGLTLIKFEDAVMEFKKFSYKHHFETLEVYLRAIKSHFKNELKWQAASILGSVDFLGNPLGFANDLSEGVSGLLFEGSVTSLVKNVTHGISNSTAKLTETISDGLGRVVLNDQDTETRQRILEISSCNSSSGKHLAAGLKGFGFGILGGVTSIVRHTYEGAQNDGIQGFISGLGRGIVGTVTKPLIGVLDLASETANAVKETSKTAHRILPERRRLPRCACGFSGLLPPYSSVQSKGQQHLFLINKRNFSEEFCSYEPKLYESRDSKLRLLVSSENVWVYSMTENTTTIILSYNLSEVVSCHSVSVNTTSDGTKLRSPHFYIELCLRTRSSATSGTSLEVVKRPRVRCQSEEMAQKASRQINYAKSIYYERDHTLKFDLMLDS